MVYMSTTVNLVSEKEFAISLTRRKQYFSEPNLSETICRKLRHGRIYSIRIMRHLSEDFESRFQDITKLEK